MKSKMRDIVVVVYHHVGTDDDPFLKHLCLGTRPERFEEHVRYFGKNFDFVSGADLVSGVLPAKPILVTFDDAYRSVLDVAAPILRSQSAPSIFFVSAGAISGSSLPIDNILSCAVEEIGWSKVASTVGVKSTKVNNLPQLIINIISMKTSEEIACLRDRLLLAIGKTESELRAASKMFLGFGDLRAFPTFRIEVGNHSMNHAFFRSLSRSELVTEIVRSQALLQQKSGQPVPYLAIPYGNRLDATTDALNLARESGHKAIFLVHAKSNRSRVQSDIYYRTYVGNASIHALLYRLKIMPLLRSGRDWLRG